MAWTPILSLDEKKKKEGWEPILLSKNQSSFMAQKETPFMLQTSTPAFASEGTPNITPKSVVGKIGDFARDIFQAFTSGGARLGAELGKAVTGSKNDINLQPTTKLEQIMYGKKPVVGFQKYGEETLSSFGASDKYSKPFGLAVGVGLTALDVLPSGGGRKVAQKLAKETSEEVIKNTLKTEFKTLTKGQIDNLTPKIAKNTNAREIQTLVDNSLIDNVLPKTSKAIEYDQGYFGRKTSELADLPVKIQEKDANLQILKGVLAEDPASELQKYVSRTGEFKGGLVEVGGGNTKFSKYGDEIASNLGFKDSEEARLAYNNFVLRKQEVQNLERELKQEIIDYKLQKETAGQVVPKSPAVKALESLPITPDTSEARTLQKVAEESLSTAKQGSDVGALSLPRSIQVSQTPVNKKVNALDFFRTPDRVLSKIGLGKEADMLRESYDAYLKELPQNIDKITEWSKQLPKESNERLFKWLDGQAIDLTENELRVGKEIKTWLGEWAERLNLPKDNRIADYITHIFDDQLIKKEFDEDLAKIISDRVAGSVYDPFLQKRLGAKGYIQDTWKALDAYVKRATRKVNLDPALAEIADKAGRLEDSQWKYVKSYIDRVNLRPTELDNYVDNAVKSVVGYKFGQRPVNALSRTLRQMTYRAFLGGNVSSAMKNLSQGANTYAKLGEKYTLVGYSKLFSKGAQKELLDNGVLNSGFIQDRALSATKKALQKVDDALFYFFEGAEKINRGAAYFGAKSKALANGKTEEEAIKIAKKLVRDTQFTFGSIDTPIILGSDIAKTAGQFQSFTTKQLEFLVEMAKNKEFSGLMRYALAGTLFVSTIGKAFGMELKDLIPTYRIGVPPSLSLPAEVGKAVVDAPDQYGNDRSTMQKLKDIGKSALSLIPGSSQVKKTIQGIQAFNQGASTSASGRVRYTIPQTLANRVRTALFGQYSTDEARDYFDSNSFPLSEKQSERILEADDPNAEFQKIKQEQAEAEEQKAQKEAFKTEVFDVVQELVSKGGEAEAKKIIDAMTDEEYDMYKSIRSSYRAKNTSTVRELLNQNPAKAVEYVRSLPKQEAERVINLLDDGEYSLYEEGKKTLEREPTSRSRTSDVLAKLTGAKTAEAAYAPQEEINAVPLKGTELSINRLKREIQFRESGDTGGYDTVGVTDDLGKYQISPATLKTWSPIFLGREVSREEFLNSPELQEKFIEEELRYLNENGAKSLDAFLILHHRGWSNFSSSRLRELKNSKEVQKYLNNQRNG